MASLIMTYISFNILIATCFDSRTFYYLKLNIILCTTLQQISPITLALQYGVLLIAINKSYQFIFMLS